MHKSRIEFDDAMNSLRCELDKLLVVAEEAIARAEIIDRSTEDSENKRRLQATLPALRISLQELEESSDNLDEAKLAITNILLRKTGNITK